MITEHVKFTQLASRRSSGETFVAKIYMASDKIAMGCLTDNLATELHFDMSFGYLWKDWQILRQSFDSRLCEIFLKLAVGKNKFTGFKS